MDCACGAGATLIAAAEASVEHGINYPYQVMFAAQEIDSTTALMCYIQLSLLGCAGYVVIRDSLCDPMTGHVLFGEDTERCWFTPMFFEETWHRRREIEYERRRFRYIMGVLGGMGKPKDDAEQEGVPHDEPAAAEPMVAEIEAPASLLPDMSLIGTSGGDTSAAKPKAARKPAKKPPATLEGQITFQF